MLIWLLASFISIAVIFRASELLSRHPRIANVFAYMSAFIGFTMDGPGDWYLSGGGKGIGMAIYMMLCYVFFWFCVVANIVQLVRGKGFWYVR